MDNERGSEKERELQGERERVETTF